MLDGKCQPKEKCVTCQDENSFKYAGDNWNKDNCTKCSCSIQGTVTCVSRTCEQKVCGLGFVLETSHGGEDTCCPRQECVPSNTKCAELIQPECGPFQEVRSVLGSDSCPRYVCGEY